MFSGDAAVSIVACDVNTCCLCSFSCSWEDVLGAFSSSKHACEPLSLWRRTHRSFTIRVAVYWLMLAVQLETVSEWVMTAGRQKRNCLVIPSPFFPSREAEPHISMREKERQRVWKIYQVHKNLDTHSHTHRGGNTCYVWLNIIGYEVICLQYI